MKRILLFLTCVLTLFGVAMAEESFSLSWGKNYWPDNTSYTSTFTSTTDFGGSKWDVVNFNNNNWSWGDIRCGRSKNASVASIYNKTALSQKVTKIVVKTTNQKTADASKINSVSLYIAKDANFNNPVKVSYDDFSSYGEWTLNVPSENATDGFFKFEIDCASASNNGFVSVDSFTVYYDDNQGGEVTPPVDPDEPKDPDPENPGQTTGAYTFDFTTSNYGLPAYDSQTKNASYVTDKTTITEEGVSLYFTGSSAWRMWSDGLRVYKSSSPKVQISVEGGYITKITWTANSGVVFKVENTQIDSWSGNAESVTLDGSSGTSNAALKTLTIEYTLNKGGNPDLKDAELSYSETEATAVLNKEFSAPTLNNPNSLSPISYISSKPGVATINESGEVTIFALGSTTITASFEGNDEYNYGKASYTLNVTPEEGTALTVAQALAGISNGFTGNAQVEGVISQISEVSVSNGNATYYIKDDMSDEDALQVYRGKWLNGDSFTDENQLEVGASVVVEGDLLLYNNNTPEINTGSKLISYKAPNGTKVSLEWVGESAYEVEMNSTDGFELPELRISSVYEFDETAVKKLVRYNSSNTSIASVNEDNTSVTFDLSKSGTTTITAYLAENDDYRADEVSFTLKVKNPNVVVDVITMEALGEKAGSSYTKHTLSYYEDGSSKVDEKVYGEAARVYATYTAYTNGTVQLRSSSSDSGIAVIANKGYKAVSVTVDWNSSTSNDRTIEVYANSNAYTSPSELYSTTGNTNQGTKVGTISNSDKETSYSFDSEEPVNYIGIRSNNGAIYLNSITIEWEKLPVDVRLHEGSDETEQSGKVDNDNLMIEMQSLNKTVTVFIYAPEGKVPHYQIVKKGVVKDLDDKENQGQEEDMPSANNIRRAADDDSSDAPVEGNWTAATKYYNEGSEEHNQYHVVLNTNEYGVLHIRYADDEEGNNPSNHVTYAYTISLETPTGVETVVVGEGEIIYFDLNGRRVANPDKGIFIKVEAGKVSKVIL